VKKISDDIQHQKLTNGNFPFLGECEINNRFVVWKVDSPILYGISSQSCSPLSPPCHVKTPNADWRWLCRLEIFILICYFSVSFTFVCWRCVYKYFLLFAMPIYAWMPRMVLEKKKSNNLIVRTSASQACKLNCWVYVTRGQKCQTLCKEPCMSCKFHAPWLANLWQSLLGDHSNMCHTVTQWVHFLNFKTKMQKKIKQMWHTPRRHELSFRRTCSWISYCRAFIYLFFWEPSAKLLGILTRQKEKVLKRITNQDLSLKKIMSA